MSLFSTAVSFAIAGIYLEATPAAPSNTPVLAETILLYAHSLTWLVLGIASLVWGVGNNLKLSIHMAYVALVIYIVFIITVLLT